MTLVAVSLVALMWSHAALGSTPALAPASLWTSLGAALVLVALAGRTHRRRPNSTVPAQARVRSTGVLPLSTQFDAAPSVPSQTVRLADGWLPWRDLLLSLRITERSAVRLGLAALLAWPVWRVATQPAPGGSGGFALALWLTILVLYLSVFVPRIGLSRVSICRREWMLIAVLGVGAALVRLYDLENNPQIFGGDEGHMAVLTRDVLRGKVTNPFSTAWMGHPTLFYFLQAIPMRLFGEEVFAVRVMPALAGAVTVPLTYLLGRALFGRFVGLVAAALLATSFWHVYYSRIGLNNALDPAFQIAAMLLLWYGLYRAHPQRRPAVFTLCGVVAGLAQYGYTSARLIPIMLVAVLAHACIVQRAPRRRLEWLADRRLALLALAAGFLVATFPLIGHYVTTPGAFMSRVNQASVFHSGWLEHTVRAEDSSAGAVLLRQLGHTLQAFHRHTNRIAFFNPGRPLWMEPANLFLVVGVLAALVRPFHPAGAMLLVLFFGTAITGGALSETSPNSARLILLAPVVALLIALGIATCGAAVGRALGSRLIGPLLAVAVVVPTMWADLRFFFVTYPPLREFDNNSAMTTDLARYVHRLGPEARRYRVYLFGEPAVAYRGFQSLTFLTDSLPGTDVPAGALDPAQYVDPAAGAIFAVPVFRAPQLERLVQLYAQGETRTYLAAGGKQEPLLTIYRVTPEEIAARTPRAGSASGVSAEATLGATPAIGPPPSDTGLQPSQPAQPPQGAPAALVARPVQPAQPAPAAPSGTSEAVYDASGVAIWNLDLDGDRVRNVPLGRQIRIGGPQGPLFDVLEGGRLRPVEPARR